MADEKRAIQNMVDNWLAASKAGDLATVLSLMSDDAVFMVPGREPFGKEAFAARSNEMKNLDMDAKYTMVELRVLGDWAWMRSHLKMTITPRGGKPVTQSGYILTILQKKPDGHWAIARDANLLMPEEK